MGCEVGEPSKAERVLMIVIAIVLVLMVGLLGNVEYESELAWQQAREDIYLMEGRRYEAG